MNTQDFDKIMNKITEVDKKWWIVGFFGIVVISNLLG